MNKDQIIEMLKMGKVGVIPTDTQYGVVTQALNQNSVERVYKIRKRSPDKPFIILISSLEDLSLFGISLDEQTKNFLNKIWPNPVSVILPVKNNDFGYLHRGTNTLAFRIPNNLELLEILKNTGPLIAPSANLEEHPYAKNIDEAENYFGDNIDFYKDSGTLISNPSTLIKIEEGKIEILRQGDFKLTEEKISG